MTLDADKNAVTGAGAERRSAVRSAIRRKAKFSARAGKGFLRDGAVVDISREGLQLQTYDAPLPGTFVELEIQPRDTDIRAQVTMVRGRVVRATPLENGLTATGVRFHMAPLEPPTPLPPKPAEGDETLAEAPRSGATTLSASSPKILNSEPSPLNPVPARGSARKPLNSETFRFRTLQLKDLQTLSGRAASNTILSGQTSSVRRHWRKVAMVAVALVLALLLWNEAAPFDKQANADASRSAQSPVRIAAAPSVTLGATSASNTPRPRAQKLPMMPSPARPSGGSGAPAGAPSKPLLQPAPSAGAEPVSMPAPPASTVAVAPRSRPNGLSASAPVSAALGLDNSERPEPSSAEQVLDRVDRAQLALALGKKEEAQQLLNGVAEFAVDAPEVWRKYAVVLASNLSNPSNDSVDLPLFADAVELKADEPAAAAYDGLWLDVSKADYVLTAMNGSRPLRRFPVGLGKGNTTPNGNYRIANKLTNPDWYNRGETVPAGDPRNPLGKHWMGLGNERGPTSYGIHSISQPTDLGQPVGRGCIRMIPSDADALFRLCPIGTPVRIHP